jgi:hypothetical protein
MTKINARTCNLCGDYMTGGIAGFEKHGNECHPNYFLQMSSRAIFAEKNYFCPLDNKWYSCVKWLSRAITKHGWTNEQYYLTYGEKYLPEKWKENLSRTNFGHRHCANTCLQCNYPVKFNETQWQYPVFCGFSCSTTWYAKNTDRVKQAKKTIVEKQKTDPNFMLQPTQKNYWINKGFSEEEAIEKVKKRQSTNSLQSFIDRAGGDKEEGEKKFANRQQKWLTSIKKSGMHSGVSDVGNKLFESVSTIIPDIKYGKNEVVVRLKNSACKVDCVLRSKKRVIEFYGDYWHGNPKKYGPDDIIGINKIAKDKWAFDSNRNEQLNAAGYQVLVIWEEEYKNNPMETLQNCINFLNNS